MADRFAVKGNCRVDGTFIGRILLGDLIRIGPSGRVRARIVAREVEVAGSVVGDISAKNKISLFSTARVWGDLRTRELFIQEGVVFSGTCSILQEEGLDIRRLINRLFDQQQ